MPDRGRIRSFGWLAAAVMVLAFAATSLSFYKGHRDVCAARDKELNVLRDVLLIANSIPNKQRLDPEQQARAKLFYRIAFARIDKARC